MLNTEGVSKVSLFPGFASRILNSSSVFIGLPCPIKIAGILVIAASTGSNVTDAKRMP
jgi:hypothetical protein